MLEITSKAVSKIKELSKHSVFRVSVMGGGCAGFQYDFSFDVSSSDEDSIFEQDGVRVFVDEMTLPFIQGGVLEYVEELGKAGFILKNPNAKSNCGCNNSFSV